MDQAGWLVGLLTILLSIGILAGLFGSFMHIRGAGERVIESKYQ